MRGRAAALTLTAAVMLAAAGCNEDAPAVPEATLEAPATPTEPTPEQDSTEPPTQTPAPDPETYEVQRGDTLSAIAQRFGTTVEAIVEANALDDPDSIFPGDVLEIPEG